MEDSKVIEVLLVDDHQIVRDGLRHAINKQQNMLVIGEASNGEEAIIFAEDNVPDIVLMDVDMPVMDGIEATNAITSMIPKTNIIGLSLHEAPAVKKNMRKAGASAYVTKDKTSDTLCATIRKEAISEKESSNR